MLAARRFVPPAILPSIFYVQNNAKNSKSPTNAFSTVNFSPTTGAAAGHKVIAYVHTLAGSNPGSTTQPLVQSVADSLGNTWTVDIAAQGGGNLVCGALCSSYLTTAITTSTVITFTFSNPVPAASTFSYAMDEWIFPNAGSVDTSISAAKTGAANTCTLPTSTTNPSDLLISTFSAQAGASSLQYPAGYTTLTDKISYYQPAEMAIFSAAYTFSSNANTLGLLVAYTP
jgi:hypothetical protein